LGIIILPNVKGDPDRNAEECEDTEGSKDVDVVENLGSFEHVVHRVVFGTAHQRQFLVIGD
jgi:hypothetical protein